MPDDQRAPVQASRAGKRWLLVLVAMFAAAALYVVACRNRSSSSRREEGTGLPPGAVPVPDATAQSAPKEPATPPPSSGPGLLPNAPVSFAPIVKRADPSVVTIYTIGQELEPPSILSNRGRLRRLEGLGSGFIVDKDGVILTNNHVIENADVITVKLSDDRELPSKVVGRDPQTDIAVIRVDAKNLIPLPMGDSDELDVGDWVVAIGNPFGLSHTVSAGIVSGKGRTRDDVPLDPAGYYNFIQTDASINPGNSGGPLFNLNGKVVGINTAIRGGGAQGIGFAIPINMVKQLLTMLLRDGHVTRSALGVSIREVRELTKEARQALKLTDDKGAVIDLVYPGQSAEKAGLDVGDVIVAFDGVPIGRGTHLQWLASTAGVGKTVTLRVQRDGKLFDVKVTLGLLPERTQRQRVPFDR